jgi:hypothetical protein
LLEESPRVAAVLESSRPLRVEGRVLVLGFPESASFQRKTAEGSAGRDMIVKHLTGATGFAFNLQTEQLSDEEFTPGSAAEPSAGIDAEELVEALKEGFNATEIARAGE